MHASLADILLDLAQNSVEAGARRISILFREDPKEIQFRVDDDGKGMDAETLERALDPFWTDGVKHPGRRVGLGLPFLRQTADQCGGSAEVESEPGKGTRVEARFPADHLDLPPTGDLVLLWLQCLMMDGDFDMTLDRSLLTNKGNRKSYSINRRELEEVLGSFEDAGALGLLKDYLASLEDEWE